MEDNPLSGKTICGMKIYRYAGCGGCPIKDCTKTLSESIVMLRHTGNQCWDNWGRIVSVFSPGEIVKVRIKHDHCTIYCGGAESTLYPGISDYVDLENFDELKPVKEQTPVRNSILSDSGRTRRGGRAVKK